MSDNTRISEKQRVIEHLQTKLEDTDSFEKIEDEVFKLNPDPVWVNNVGRWFFPFAGVMAFISFFILLCGINTRKDIKDISIIHGVIYALWLILPPLWFFIEYIYFFPDKYKLKSNHQSNFKHQQDLASKFWAALLILFALMLFLHYGFKP